MMLSETIPQAMLDRKPTLRLHVGSPHSYYGEPNGSKNSLELRAHEHNAEYHTEVIYINNSTTPITVVDRSGLAVTVRNMLPSTENTFVIRKMIHLKGESLRSALRSVNTIENADAGELIELKRCLANMHRHPTEQSASVLVDYVVSVAEFAKYGGNIYHHQCDVVLSTKVVDQTAKHPFSNAFLNVGAFGKTNNYASQNEFNLKVRLVDHSPFATPKYMNIAGKTIKLNPQKDAPSRYMNTLVNGKRVIRSYKDYLQVFYSAANDLENIEGDGVTTFIVPLDEAIESNGLFANVAEALDPGRAEIARKERLAEKLHELELIRQDTAKQKALSEQVDHVHREEMLTQSRCLDKDKNAFLLEKQALENKALELQNTNQVQKELQAKLDIQLAEINREQALVSQKRKVQEDEIEKKRKEHEAEIARQRAEHEHKLKTEAIMWKDYFESKKVVREDVSSFVKFVPGLLLGITGVAAAYFKFSADAKKAA